MADMPNFDTVSAEFIATTRILAFGLCKEPWLVRRWQRTCKRLNEYLAETRQEIRIAVNLSNYDKIGYEADATYSDDEGQIPYTLTIIDVDHATEAFRAWLWRVNSAMQAKAKAKA